MIEALGISQSAFASLLSVTQAAVSRYLAGVHQPTGEVATRFALLQKIVDDPGMLPKFREELHGKSGVAGGASFLGMTSGALVGASLAFLGSIGMGALLGGVLGAGAARIAQRLMEVGKEGQQNSSTIVAEGASKENSKQ